VVLQSHQATADFMAVSTIERPEYRMTVLKTLRIGRRGRSIDYLA